MIIHFDTGCWAYHTRELHHKTIHSRTHWRSQEYRKHILSTHARIHSCNTDLYHWIGVHMSLKPVPGSLFTTDRISLTFGRQLDSSTAVNALVNVQNDRTIPSPYLAGSRLHTRSQDISSFSEKRPGIMTEIYSMMTSSNGNIFRVTGPLCVEFSGWFETPSRSLRRRCNGHSISNTIQTWLKCTTRVFQTWGLFY